MTDSYCLRRTHRGYSSGTRIALLNHTKAKTVFVSVNGTKEVLEIPEDELVKLRPRIRTYAK